jgi:hypothetical protein
MDDEASRTEETTRSKPQSTSHPELNDALSRHNLSLFIGADLFREVTSLPSRADLARELARRRGLDKSLSLSEVAQRVTQGSNRWEFTAFIRDALDTTGRSPQPFHRYIVTLVREHQIKTVITTAYDTLLELAFQEAGIALNRVVRSSDVSFIDPNRPTLVKLYGDAQQPDTLIVTEDDHYGLWRDRDKEDLLDEVRLALRRNVILFLGYNLSDPDFQLLWREVLDRAGRFPLGAYAIWSGLPEADVQMWRDRGIIIEDVDPLQFLGEVSAQPVLTGRSEEAITAPAGLALSSEPLILRQLAEARENLLLIQERKSQYVEETAIPLDLIKVERRTQKRIAELERQIEELEQPNHTE